jgi:LysR family glycine cleavage system transcriptional activator
MYRIPPLAAVRAFEAAARHENFSRAGDELGMTQAAISYQMKLLEDRMGAPLFARQRHGMMLTELGRRIAPSVTEAFVALDRAFATARAENENVLSITAPRTFSTNWLAGKLGDFHVAQPSLAVRLDVTDTMADLASGEFDVAIRGMPSPQPGLICHFLMRMPVTPLASPAFLAHHRLDTPADLLTVPRLSPNDDWWDLWFGSLDDPQLNGCSQPGIRFESQVLDGHSAMAGHGVAILSPPMFQSAIEAGLLVQPFPQIADYRNGFWLVYTEQKRNLPKVRALRDWLLDTVTRSVGADPYRVLQPYET